MTITDEMIEAAAKASYETMAFPGDFGTVKWDGLSPFDRKIYKMRARAALAAVLPIMDGWQPIETAPNDLVIMVYGKWVGEIGDWSTEPPSIGVAINSYGEWSSVHSDYYSVNCVATHWRPLPPPPKGDGT